MGGALPDEVNGVATPIDFGLTPAGPAGAPPAIGADADALLEGLGLSHDEVARLRGAGVIGGDASR
jgi:crotonobetainyl-CoA:carnitine CoA-transferase CaiB-like acyl-CoA transferase